MSLLVGYNITQDNETGHSRAVTSIQDGQCRGLSVFLTWFSCAKKEHCVEENMNSVTYTLSRDAF